MKKTLKKILNPVYRLLTKPKNRLQMLPVVNQLFGYNRREEIFKDVFGFVNFTGVEGDYMEFGTWKGGSLTTAYFLAKQFPALARWHYYAFDSFEGLPEITGVDNSTGEFKAGDYAVGLPALKTQLAKNGLDLNRITFTAGWYSEVLNGATAASLPLKKAAVILVDCDLYESTVDVLNFITPYVVDGTVIIFDDWFCFKGHPDRGEQKAFREWLDRNKDIAATSYKQYGWMGNSFILHR
jgi:O-methyltransferase